MNPIPTQEDVTKRGYIQGAGNDRFALGSQGATDFLLKESSRLLSSPPSPDPAAKEPTIGDIYGGFKMPNRSNQDINSALDMGISMYGRDATTPIDEGLERSKVLSQFQREIDATNAIYADKLREARQAGIGRLGSAAAIAGRSGTAGSDFAAAQQDNISAANLSIEDAVRQEQLARISEIMNKAGALASSEIAAKREAQKQGLDSYLKFIGAKDERRQTGISEIAKAMIAQKIDPATLGTAALDKIAKAYGATADEILAAYSTTKIAEDRALEDRALATRKAEAEIANNELKTIGEGQSMYRRRPDGTYELVASKPKTYAPSSSGSSGSPSPSPFANNLDAIIGSTLATIPSKFGQQTFNAQMERARSDADKINLVASVVLRNAPAAEKTDFSNQAKAIRQIDNAISAIDSKAKTGVISNTAQYAFNIFGKDYDPKLAAIGAYITAAVQPYRSSVTGAAWGEQEEAEYANLFGSTRFSPKELRERLVRVREIMRDKSADGLNVYVNPLGMYDNPFVFGEGSAGVFRAPDNSFVEIID